MRTQPARFRSALALFVLFSQLPLHTSAQTSPTLVSDAPANRIIQAVDESRLTLLKGNTYFMARAQYDRGPAPAGLPMNRMLLVLRRSPGQEAALQQLLDEQQDQSSSNYHKWLTPEQFGQQFGPSDQDIQTITSWLQSQGFQIARVSNGRTVIEFSGTAGQVQQAFHTSIHKYAIPTATGIEEHWANATDPQIPTALAPVIIGIDTLHNFPRKPMHVVAGVFSKNKNTGQVTAVKPEFTFACGSSSQPATCYGLGPSDFATIYSVLPLWNGSPVIDGVGQTIGIIGETDVDLQDLAAFKSLFGLPANPPVVVMDGPDPGIVPGDETESDLDLQWSSAIAKNATIKFVISATTNTTLGVDLSAQYAVDNNVAPVLSESYGICELGLGTAGNQFYNALWQQAAAQGTTVFVSAGDSGSAGCDNHDAPSPAPSQFGLQVSGFASTPYNVAVGGTDFNDLSNPSTYWSATNNSTTQASAKSYIPEVPWNDSCTSQALVFYGFSSDALTNCNDPQLQKVNVVTLGGSGGKSSCTTGDGMDVTSCSGGYAKPSWQTGTGVPNDSKRDIPDVSLFAAAGFYTLSFYIVCEADQTGGTYCNQSPQSLDFLGVGGTSASSPAFAGIMALVNQKTASRQGNANYILYKLAAKSGASCVSAGTPASTCIFYDINTGTNAMPCAGSPNCGSAGTDGIGILSGYSSNTGYDLSTGLGSVNAANLVNQWSTITSALKSSTTTLTLSPTTSIVHGSPVNVTIDVAPVAPATGTPTGTIALEAPTSIDPGIESFSLTSGAFSGTTDVLPGGSYSVTAHYPGDGTFAASTSAPVAVTVTPEQSSVAVSIITQNAQGMAVPFSSGPYGGSSVYTRADVTGRSGNGFPSGSVTFKDDGQAINGGLTLPLNSQGNALPTNPISSFTAGAHSITAAYSGDASFDPSTSPTASFTITQAVVTAEAPNVGNGTSTFGSSALLSAIITSQSCGNLPTGTITFFDGSTQLGTAQTIQSSRSGTCAVQATASLTTSAFTLGNNSIMYKYSGDTNYGAANSVAVTDDAQIGTAVALTSSAPTIQQGQSITFTAKITPAQTNGPAITGTVSFTSNSNSLGSAPVMNGQAQLPTTALSAGSDQIVANYSGDTNYASASFVITQQVTPGPDFSVSVAPSTINISAPGGSGTTMLTVSGSNGFNSQVSFSSTCSNLPSESTCSFSQAMVAVGSSTTLTISTTAPSFLVPANRHIEWGGWQANAPALRLFLCFAVLLALGIQMHRRQWNFTAAALVLGLLIANAACGGSGGGGSPKNPGTPLVQNQTITVSANSGSITHTFTFTLNVN